MGPVQYTGFMVLTDELRGSIPLQATTQNKYDNSKIILTNKI